VFLIVKATQELHSAVEGENGESKPAAASGAFWSIIAQIILIDMVFSLDSIITAVGIVDEIQIMIAAVVTSVALMMVFAGHIGRFVSAHPTIKMLALSFLLLIGTTLVAEGFHVHFSKNYVYFAMAFSVFVETLNIRMKKKVVSKKAA